MELTKWQIAKGDTLSDIAQKLLPNNAPLREQLMYQILELNPIAFPTNNIDFMLAFNTLFFPSVIDGINIKQLLNNQVISMGDLKDAPLYVMPTTLNIDNNKTNRFYSISGTNIETELDTTATVALHGYKYVTAGNLSAKVTINNGPSYLLTPNTRIKVSLQNNNNEPCQVNLIYGLLRVLERDEQAKHCSILTPLAKITANNSAYIVRVCHPGSCIIESEKNGEFSLPAGVYFGVVEGKISLIDKTKQYQVGLGEIKYYSPKNTKPLAIKHFKGLLFNNTDLLAIKNNAPKKKQFGWGTIQNHSQDDGYIESHLDIKTDYLATELTEEVQIIEQEVQEAETLKDEPSDNTSTLDRFN